jgi:hypothetical protein
MHFVALVVLGLALLSAAPSVAGALAPAKASDLVVAVTKDQVATCTGGGRPFDTRILPDGSEEPFVIPEKRVLVITSLDWNLGSSPGAGELALPTVLVKNGANSFPILQASGFTDPDGTAGGTVLVPNGVPVRAGSQLCILGGTQPNGLIHGFFAKDK